MVLDSTRKGDGLSSSNLAVCLDEEAMGGEYMRVLDALSSLREACSMYQRQTPPAMAGKQRSSFSANDLSLSLLCSFLFLC
jgi:hypothetical protein